MNTVTASVSGENLEKSRCKMQLCKQLGIPTRRISDEKRIGTKIFILHLDFSRFSPLTDAVTVFITVRASFDRFNLADSTIS
jgi:hypothetical protein